VLSLSSIGRTLLAVEVLRLSLFRSPKDPPVLQTKALQFKRVRSVSSRSKQRSSLLTYSKFLAVSSAIGLFWPPATNAQRLGNPIKSA
jgi:hypothetical protein